LIATFDDLPGWCFELVDDSAEAYEIVAYDLAGRHRLSAQGSDMDALIHDLRARASQLIAASRPPRNA
jgi:hypothetical protein